MQETHVTSLGWEDPLEMGMATHSSIVAWRILWTEEPCGLQPVVLQSRARLSDLSLLLSFSTRNSTQYSLMTYMRKESKKEGIYVYV